MLDGESRLPFLPFNLMIISVTSQDRRKATVTGSNRRATDNRPARSAVGRFVWRRFGWPDAYHLDELERYPFTLNHFMNHNLR